MSLILDALRRVSRQKSGEESGGELGRIPTTLPSSFSGKRRKVLPLRLKLILVPIAAATLLVALSISHLDIKTMLNPIATMKTRVISKNFPHREGTLKAPPGMHRRSNTPRGASLVAEEEPRGGSIPETSGKSGGEAALPMMSEAKGHRPLLPQKKSEKSGSSFIPATTETEGALREGNPSSHPSKPPDKTALATEGKPVSPQEGMDIEPPAIAQQETPEKKPPTLLPEVNEPLAEKTPPSPSYKKDERRSPEGVKEEEEREATEHFNSALGYHRRREYESAIREYEKALRLDPYNATTYNNLGMIFRDTQRMDEAIRMYKKALFLRPNFEKAHNNLGVAYYLKGNLKEAEQELLMALSIEPKSAEGYVNLGLIYSEMGLSDKAIEALARAVKYDPENPQAHYNLAMLLEKEGSYREAKEHYTRFLFLSPEGSENIRKRVTEHIKDLDSAKNE